MVTDAQVEAACRCFYDMKFGAGSWPNTSKHSIAEWRKRMRAALEAAEKAREAPHELIMKVQSDPRASQSASFHSTAPYVPQEPVTITRIVAGFPIPPEESHD